MQRERAKKKSWLCQNIKIKDSPFTVYAFSRQQQVIANHSAARFILAPFHWPPTLNYSVSAQEYATGSMEIRARLYGRGWQNGVVNFSWPTQTEPKNTYPSVIKWVLFHFAYIHFGLVPIGIIRTQIHAMILFCYWGEGAAGVVFSFVVHCAPIKGQRQTSSPYLYRSPKSHHQQICTRANWNIRKCWWW